KDSVQGCMKKTFINPTHTREALQCFKIINENYKEIEINEIDDNYLANNPAVMNKQASADNGENETTDDTTESEGNVVGEAMQVDNNNDYNFVDTQTVADHIVERNDGVSVALRKPFSGKDRITVGQTFTDVRGSPQYEQHVLKDLFGYIRQLNTSTFFVTLSCVDMFWKDYLNALAGHSMIGVKDEYTHAEKENLIRRNLVLAARLFSETIFVHFLIIDRFQ
ncbi:unnamed protein product, partial [Didymodactylos carnosus]